MMLYKDITGLIGNTPIVKINHLPCGKAHKNLFVKLERYNPSSIKDRIAKKIIEDAENRGDLNNDSVILESSSGNTGIGLSMVCRVKGYRNIVILDKNCPPEKVKTLGALGAHIVMIKTRSDGCEDLTERRIELVKRIKELLNNIFVPNQYQNPSAPLAHYEGTGREIIDAMEDTGIRFDAVFLSVGTGGTISGVSKRLKEYDPAIRVFGVEPDGSTLFGGEKRGYLQQGPGNYFIPDNLHYKFIDAGFKVSDHDAFNTCRLLAKEEGLLVGGSSGGVFYEAMKRSCEFKGNILCVLPDGGEKYLDTVYSDDWMMEHGIELDRKCINKTTVLSIDEDYDTDGLAEQVIKEVFQNG